MILIPNRFLVRLRYACPLVAGMPGDEESLIDLPESARLDPFADLDDQQTFADVRLAWNATGMGLSVDVRGKKRDPIGDIGSPTQSDGVTIWIDTRADRTSHRALRTCHQFHFLAAGGGANKREPAFVQTKINRAIADAPIASTEDVPFRMERTKTGYRLEAFLSANVLNGFDPEQNPVLGVFYLVRDFELGEQSPGAGPEFPYHDDPSLWASLELVGK